MIEEQYISFETAKLAKEKGFDIPTNTYFSYFPKISEYGLVYVCAKLKDYNSEDINNGEYRISRPTQSILARWLREKHNMCGTHKIKACRDRKSNSKCYSSANYS